MSYGSFSGRPCLSSQARYLAWKACVCSYMAQIRPLLTALCFVLPLAAEPVVEGEWPRWRGPYDNGVARGAAPTKFSQTENILWKAEIPGRGHSSPVIWKDRIFVTTAVETGKAPAPSPEPEQGAQGRRKGGPGGGGGMPLLEHRFLVIALDRATGKKLWEKVATTETPHEGHHNTYGSFASNSPVTDGKILITSFGSRGVYAYDLDGNLKWEKGFGKFNMRLSFGEGAAPVLHGDTLILNFDHQGEDFIVALDKSTGKELWRQAREEESNWSAPLVIEHGGKTQVIVSATARVKSYDIETGEEMWECGGLGLNTIPAPVYDGENVYVMSGYRDQNMFAIKLDGAKGDLTGSEHVLWTNQRGNSYTPSPVLHDGILYFTSDNGMISAMDARTGEPHYIQQRLPKPTKLKSSPVAAGEYLYQATEDGEVVVVKLGKEYEVESVNRFGDEFFIATPAIADGKIYLRGQNTLYAIGQ
jgi:outer membrane protein assembly factor BamB